jgi:hypothetical protein
LLSELRLLFVLPPQQLLFVLPPRSVLQYQQWWCLLLL